MYVAAAVSFPGGLVVSIFIKLLSKLVISCSVSRRIAGFMGFVAPPLWSRVFFLLRVSIVSNAEMEQNSAYGTTMFIYDKKNASG